MRKRLPVRQRGDTSLDALGNRTRRESTEEHYGRMHGNTPTGSRDNDNGGGGGLSCDYTEFGGGGGRGGDARDPLYYTDPFYQDILYFALKTKGIQYFYL